MHTVGVICEYNPFHTGHARQLAELRRRFGAETAVVCAMSGNFVQRGEAAVLRKHVRAEAAVRGGADLVLELPLPWAVSSAEGFAQGGAEVLTAAGVADTLAFGSECADTERLLRAARTLLREDFPAALRAELSKGDSFAAARQRAAARFLGAEAAVLRDPNDILGVEYCKALLRLGSPLRPLALPRFGPGHDGGVAGDYASASEVRERLLCGENAARFLPPETLSLWEREHRAGRAPARLENGERAVLAALRRMGEEDFARYDEGREGLYHRFFDASRRAKSIAELLSAAATRRYPLSRLRRMLLSIYLGLSPPERPERTPYLRVLAMNDQGKALLHEMRSRASLPVLVKPADVRALSPEAVRLMETEARATDLYTLLYPDLSQAEAGGEWRTGPVIVSGS